MKRLLGLLGWLGVVLVLAAVAIRFVKPEWQPWSQRLALAGLAVTAAYALSQWRDIGRSFQGRSVRYGSMAIGGIVLFLGMLVAINYIGNRQHKRWDLTAARQFSLSDQTRKILTDLKGPVKVTVFYDSRTPQGSQPFRDRLGEYQNVSKQITVDYVDAVRDPITPGKYDVQTLPTIVFEYAGRTERATQSDEQDFTNALKKIIEGKPKKIYFVQGHGEHDTAANDRNGYTQLAESLKSDNFEVAKLTLAQEGKVPDDATVVVIAGPKIDYLAPEVDALKAFLKRGGKLLLMIDPPAKADSPQPTSLIALAKEWGITVGDDLVVDASGVGRVIGAGPEVPIAMPLRHPITDRFELMTAFPLARSVTPIEGGTDGKGAQKVLETSPQSWAETDLKGLFATGRPERNLDKGDKAGPVSVAAAVSGAATDAPAPATPEAPRQETRLVVVGDSDFVSNVGINIQGNKDLCLNMANWLAQQESLIAIRPRDPDDRRITLTQDQSQRIAWLTIIIIPALLLVNAGRVWWRRR